MCGRQPTNAAVNGTGMKIPAGVFLDAIDDMLLVQDQVVIRVGVGARRDRRGQLRDSGRPNFPLAGGAGCAAVAA